MTRIRVCLLILVFLLTSCTVTPQSSDYLFQYSTSFTAPSSGFVSVSKQKGSHLEIDPGTMDIRYTKDDTVWVSRSFDSIDSEAKDIAYDSLFVIRGLSFTGNEFVLDSFTACIAKGQYETHIADNKMTAVFTVGDIDTRIILPEIIRASVLENQILNALEDRDRSRFVKRYNMISLDDAESEQERNELLESYPILAESALYIIASDITEREKKQLADNAAKVGYTAEMLDAEYEALGFTEDDNEDNPVFEITMIFSISEGDLIVEIPKNKIKYDSHLYILNKIDFLKNFAAAEASDTIEIFIPDGVGAIIDPSRVMTDSGFISKQVYSRGHYIDNVYGDELTSFPVFGFSKINSSLFAIIEDGDAIASIAVEYTSIKCNVYASFEYQPVFVESKLDGWQNITINHFDKTPPNTDIRLRYILLPEGSAWTEMAQAYKYYLESKGCLTKDPDIKTSLYVETLGSVMAKQQFGFFDINTEVPLTTFNDNSEIIEHLIDLGVDQIKLILTAADKGGMQNNFSGKFDPGRLLGGISDYIELLDFLEEHNIETYVKNEFVSVFRNNIFDGFFPLRDAVRTLTGKYSLTGEYNLATGDLVEKSHSYIITPRLLTKRAVEFAGSLDLNKVNLHAGGLGDILVENHANSDPIDRSEALVLYTKALTALSGNNKLMINGANSYVLPFADDLMELPSGNSQLLDYTDSVPFMQMVLHGNTEYSIRAVNRSNDFRTSVLKCIELGSSIHVVLTYQNSEVLRNTPFSYYLSTNSDYWLPKVSEAYVEIQEALEGVKGSQMVGHKKINENLTETTYANGTRVIVNYSENQVEYDGMVIDARDHISVKGQPYETN